jgi:outer membrane protein TolC
LEIEQVRAAVTSALAGHIVAQRQLRERVRRIESDLEPAVVAAAENMTTAYTIGRTSYSDLLEVQRALLELRQDANDVRLAVVQEIIAIERLTGRTIEELMRHE